MTLAEKVQLITGALDIFAAIFGYFIFSFYFKKKKKDFLIPFLKYLALGSSCIGGHQVFEYFSLITGSQLIYKIGLIISISGMILFLVSLEKLYNKDLYSKNLKWLVVLLAVYLFSRPVEFTTFKFHLEHHSVLAWSFLWFVFFIYWIVCILLEQKKVANYVSMKLAIIYMLSAMTLSFIIAVVYSVISYFSVGVNICTTYPSVWCTFGVIQMIVNPFFLMILAREVDALPPKSKLDIGDAFKYMLIVTIVTMITMWMLAKTSCLSWEFIIN